MKELDLIEKSSGGANHQSSKMSSGLKDILPLLVQLTSAIAQLVKALHDSGLL